MYIYDSAYTFTVFKQIQKCLILTAGQGISEKLCGYLGLRVTDNCQPCDFFQDEQKPQRYSVTNQK